MTDPIRLPDLSTKKDFAGDEFAPLYTTTVTVDGGAAAHGRASGRARSSDGALDLELRMPAELGGTGEGTNPEQLFAAGIAACFHGVLSLLARQESLDPTAVTVLATVAFGRDPGDGGYLLHVDLVVRWPGVPRETATSLMERADALCPYARMAWRGTPITITLAP
ncbi:Ohr family peroxiredoxin [Streptomyces sp. VRA16 Mangrove soil]|uniref:Ohr family peroxiredoxin n=1 Tax=Streptomyces sp. VRA16 Mangrove soil TaxID=2817434 RepID=UPI001A9F0F2F|nr:Ohr family peroxiredoxin [Streptomyces sp. VRA16 Mangrove soil]MBO1332498.1 Ohr family peroxiredoxin [Streptomyces sp. VRA16 Mangrove soil]